MTLPPFKDRRQLEEQDPVLVDGIPGRMTHSLLEWLDRCFKYRTPGAVYPSIRTWMVDRLERVLDLQLGSGQLAESRLDQLKRLAVTDGDIGLYVINAVLGDIKDETDSEAAAMTLYLTESASAYEVEWTGEHFRLTERVGPAVRTAVERVLETDDRAGVHLARAWSAAYGMNTNPSEAFQESVLAVEAASWSVIIPANDRATLGTVIKGIYDNPAKWEFILDGPGRKRTPMEDVAGMMDRLWKTQIRHATDGGDSPLDVTPEQGQAAVHLAATLVHWFQTGAVRRVDAT